MINRKDNEESYIDVLEDMHDHKIISSDTYDKVLDYGEQDKGRNDFKL